MGEMSDPLVEFQLFTAEELSSGWTFKETDSSGKDDWMAVRKVPSTVQQDLMDNKK